MNLRGLAAILAVVLLIGIADATTLRVRTRVGQLRGPDFGRKSNLATPAPDATPSKASNPPQVSTSDVANQKPPTSDPPLTGALATAIADQQALFAAYWDSRGVKTSVCPKNCYGINGRCLQGKCICKVGWRGADCHLKDPKFDLFTRCGLFGGRGPGTNTTTPSNGTSTTPPGGNTTQPTNGSKPTNSTGTKPKASLRATLLRRDDFEAVLDDEQEDEIRKLAARLYGNV